MHTRDIAMDLAISIVTPLVWLKAMSDHDPYADSIKVIVIDVFTLAWFISLHFKQLFPQNSIWYQIEF